MNQQKEAMRLALDALRDWVEYSRAINSDVAIEALTAALALPDAEPVGTAYTMEALVPGGGIKHHVTLYKPLPSGTQLYTGPQSSTTLADTCDMGNMCLQCPDAKPATAPELLPDVLNALETLLDRIDCEGATPLDWPEYYSCRRAIEAAQQQKQPPKPADSGLFNARKEGQHGKHSNQARNQCAANE